MLSATYPPTSLSHIAKQETVSLKSTNIEALFQQRKYVLFDVPNVKNPVRLTMRQLQCLILVVKGYNDGLAAETLQISPYTFYEHMRLVAKKFAAHKRSVLIQRALAAKVWL